MNFNALRINSILFFRLPRKIHLIMKITALLLLVTTMAVSASTFAQKITLNEKNASLQTVLKAIHDQSGFDFFYNDEVLEKAQPITVQIKDVSLEQALRVVLSQLAMIYEIEDGTVLIKMKPLVAAGPPATVALNILTGIVRDSLGHPIPGATVKLTPGRFAVATDKNGLFAFKDVPTGSYTLSITSVGFQSLQMDIEVNENTKASTLFLVLKEAISSLGEVTVNTGYQRIKPEQSTGATARIGTKEYESRISTDFLSGLANKMPGLLINNDIQFGDDNNKNSLFQVRGLSTISGNNRPLIVVDGYPTELTLDMIDPNEIKSVTLLKDAAAATVYGVRASNGVIVIERKQADQGKPRVDFRTTFSLKPKENYSRYRWDPDGANTIINFDRLNYNSPLLYTFMNTPSLGYAFTYQPDAIIIIQQAAGLITAAQANQQLSDLASYNNTKDYSRLFLRNATTQTYNLDLTGGNQNALYYFTVNYTNNNLQQRNNDNNRLLLSGRSTLNFSQKFSLELTTDFLNAYTHASPIPDINSIYAYERFQDANGNPLPIFSRSNANPFYNQYLMNLGLPDNRYYPLVDMNEVNNRTHTVNNRITANFKYLLGNGFDLMFGGVYENGRVDTRNLASGQSSVVHQLINRYAQAGTVAGTVITNIPQGSYLQQQADQNTSYTGRAQLNYNKRFGKDHSINAILGTEIRDVIAQTNRAPYFGYNDQTLLQSPINYATIFNGSFPVTYAGLNTPLAFSGAGGIFSQLYTEDRYLSGYSNVVYSFRNKYSLTGSIRIDQSNLFGTDPKYKYKPLWSLGAGWNIDQESFMHNVNWVKALKLRAAYGFNGNVAKLALPQIIATAAYNNFYPVNSTPVPMLSLSSFANSSLRWEQTRNGNLGLDYTIFKNITGSVDIYDKRSTDLLAPTQLDASKGGQSALLNTASILNRGLEIALHADWITRKNFNWNTGINFNHNTSKVLEVYNNTLTPSSLSTAYVSGSNANYFKGYPVGAVFEYHLAGLDATGNQLITATDGTVHTMRSPVDKGIDDVYYAGSTIPAYNAGLSNRIDIGKFYVYAMINYYGGFVVRAPVAYATAVRPLVGANNYWQKAGDENLPDELPNRQIMSSLGAYVGTSDRYTVRGDYFTLGDLTASYNFAIAPFFKKAGFKQFEVKLQASNIYTVALNKYNYSMATGTYAKPYVTPTYTIGLFTNF